MITEEEALELAKDVAMQSAYAGFSAAIEVLRKYAASTAMESQTWDSAVALLETKLSEFDISSRR